MLFKAKNIKIDSLNVASTSRQIIQTIYVLISLINLAVVMYCGYLIVRAMFNPKEIYNFFISSSRVELFLLALCSIVMSYIFYTTIKAAFDELTEPTLRVQLRVVILSLSNMGFLTIFYSYLSSL